VLFCGFESLHDDLRTSVFCTGWKQFAIKREALNRSETEIQGRAENDEVQRQLFSEIDEEKRKVSIVFN